MERLDPLAGKYSDAQLNEKEHELIVSMLEENLEELADLLAKGFTEAAATRLEEIKDKAAELAPTYLEDEIANHNADNWEVA